MTETKNWTRVHQCWTTECGHGGKALILVLLSVLLLLAFSARVHWPCIKKMKCTYLFFIINQLNLPIKYHQNQGWHQSQQILLFPAASYIYLMTCLPSSRLWRKSSNKQGSKATKGLLVNRIVWDFPTLSRNYPACSCSTHLLPRPDASWIVIQDLGQHQVLIMPYAV